MSSSSRVRRRLFPRETGRLQRRQAEARQVREEDMHFYRALRRILEPLFRLLFRPRVSGREHLPPEGAFLLTANHRSFFDSVFQGIVCPRPIHWMAKAELFRYPLLDRLLVALGAFPVRRGQADQEAVLTARLLLEAGQIVAIFPEGTRVREGLGRPKRGAARLAVELDLPLVPMAISGTERGALRRALWHRGERVRMLIEPPLAPEPQEDADAVTRRLWPRIERSVAHLEGHRREALAAGAFSALLLAVGLRRRRRRR